MKSKRAIGLLIVGVAFLFINIVAYVGCGSAYFRPIGAPIGERFQRSLSPDGRWRIVNYYLSEGGGYGGSSMGRATIEPASGGMPRTIYYGWPAPVSWQGPDAVFTEEESGKRHIVAVPHGLYDYRTDDAVNLYSTLALWAIPGLLVLGIGALIVITLTKSQRA